MKVPYLPSPTVQLTGELFEEKGVEVFVKRDDLIHPHVMGNKWRKLKYNLEAARHQGATTLKTFGGAFSNHITAVAAAADADGFRSIGVIRGEELDPQSNPTLRFAHSMGMQLEFVSREDFRWLKKVDGTDDPQTFVIPEGGTNRHAVRGVAELIQEIDIEYEVIAVPIGTGGTMAGLIQGLHGERQVVGVSCLKGKFIHDELHEMLKKWDVPFHNYEILTEYHFGGYGRFNQELIRFIHIFRRDFGFLVDPVYTGKLFFGVFDRIAEDSFNRGTRILLIHTGGLQGIEGFNARYGNVIRNT